MLLENGTGLEPETPFGATRQHALFDIWVLTRICAFVTGW